VGFYPKRNQKVISVFKLPYLQNFKKRSRRVYRYGRLGLNLLSGGAFIQSCYQFPSVSKIEGNSLNDYRLFKTWVSDLAHSMNAVVHVDGEIMVDGGMFVSNHISWLDTIILNNIKPLSFIARHDLEQWPFLGSFTRRMESVFINRENKFHAYRSIPAIEEKLKEGSSVHLFPESTTSVGSEVLPFYPMFYEAAVRVGCRVQPLVIRYTDAQGVQLPEPAYINDDSFFDTLERMLYVERIHAHVFFLPPLSEGLGRKELAFRSRAVIAEKLAELSS